jgi:hypothetical protein
MTCRSPRGWGYPRSSLAELGGQGEHHVLGLHQALDREQIIPHAVPPTSVLEQAMQQR